ncbi:uncharacterized protein [Spinacia oleracea]|uniref:Uncharacterized protein n=1 Tax=Spinacia oleracea TaxID=3562 RepID=A0ABM3QJP5_SPIOL|nr:uncharacterized protein LOC110783612 [Spinacia oleracea]
MQMLQQPPSDPLTQNYITVNFAGFKMWISKYANLGNLEKLDCETLHIYVKKIEFACNYFATSKNLPELRKKDVMAEMVIHCLPTRNPYIELKNRFDDMHMENGIPNYYKYGTPDSRWRYDLEIMTTIIELAEECFDDGKTVENINLTGLNNDIAYLLKHQQLPNY